MNYLTVRKRNGASIWNEMDRVFDSLFDGYAGTSAHMPAVDVRQEKDRYVLEADLPGYSENDVEVKVEDNLLTIQTKAVEEKKEKAGEQGEFLIRERRSKSFSRSFVLPKDVDAEKITAKFKNGVLQLELEKKPEAQPKNISIKFE